MGTFTVRRWVLIASMLVCQLGLAEEAELPFKLLAASKPVSMEDVDKVVEANDRAVQACNRNAHRLDTLAVLVTLTIAPDGKVSAVDAAPQSEDNGKAPAEAACLARVAKKLKFPASGTSSTVQYPFMILSRVNRSIAF